MRKTINRIGILHYTGPPIVGGVEEVIRYHTRLFLNDGFSLRLIVGEGEPFDPGIDLCLIPELKADLKRGYDEKIKARIQEKLLDSIQDLDLLIVHNILSMPLNLSATAAIVELKDEIPIIAWVHDLGRFDPQYRFGEGYPWTLLQKRVEGITYVVISEYRRQQIEELFGPGRIDVIPDGVDIFRIAGCDPELARIISPYLDYGPIALMPGRMVRRKNFELAIRITAALNEKGPFTLFITAPIDPHNPDTKSYHDELNQMINKYDLHKQVVFLSEKINLTDWSRIRSLYLLTDLLLLTSKIEGFGLPLIEAAVLKTPAFVTTIPPLEEIIGSTQTFHFPLDSDPTEVARKIHHHLYHSPVFQLKRRIIEEYSWERIYQRKIRPLILRLSQEVQSQR